MAVKTSKGPPSRNLKTVIERVTKRMVVLGTNAAEVSRKGKLGNTAVYDLLNGKNKRPAFELIKSIAEALGTTVSYLVGETDDPHSAIVQRDVADIKIVGIAEAGAFRQMNDFEQGQSEDVPSKQYPLHARLFSSKHFALTVRGDSMNEAKPYPIVDGTTVFCVDFVDAGLAIEDGKIYAVRRTLDGGQTYECTIKRARVTRETYELVPESNNAIHKPLVLPRGIGRADDAQTIEVIGLVYGISFDAFS